MSSPHTVPDLKSEVSSEAYPLTGMQAGMLFQTLAHPEGGVDVVQVLCHLPEEVATERVAARWERAVERYDALRLGFDWTSGPAPVQRIHERCPVTIDVIETQDWSAAERPARLEAWLARDRRRPFTLASPPLFRLTLFRFAPRDHLLVFTFHHIALDGRSLLPLLREVLGGEAEQPAAHEEPPRYREYLEWMRQQSANDTGPFWRSCLGNIDFPLAWGFDLGPPAGAAPGPDLFPIVVHPFPPELSAALRLRAVEWGVTVNTFLQGAWGLLLGRASGLTKVCFGTIRACRHDTVPRALETVGLFTNTVPVAVALDDEQPVHAWLQALREDHVVLRAWEQTPLALIRQSLRLPPQVPLYETLLAFEPHDLQTQLHELGPEWRLRRFELRQHTGLPLTVAIVGRETLSLRLKYQVSRVPESLAQRLPAQFETVLWGLVEATETTRLGELAILPRAEIDRQVREFNATFRDDSHDVCLPRMFLEQAQRTPDRVAVVEGEQSLTYRELAAHATRLAQRLVSEGLQPGQGVGLWSERSLAGAVAVLGTLLAGVHYVPLPSDAPAERLALLARDAGITLVLTAASPPWREALPDVRCLPIEEARQGPVSGVSTLPSVGLDALFCVIYTSGTTGLPKGARLTHRGFTNLLRHRTGTRFEAGDFACSALTAPWHFDGSIVQLFSPLITGGTLVCCGPVTGLGRSPWYHRLTALTGASSLIAGLVREFGPPRSARVVGLGAEPLPADLLELLLRSPAFERLLTGYGVTESSCYSTDLVLFDRRTQASPETPPVTSQTVAAIGRPIANTQAYILDSRQRVLPLGVVGELCLGGVGVAQGYLRRPELTSRKFVADPFHPDLSRRLYRTGDLARWNDDGTLEFLGRRDHQVKFRGYRIELGEIEAKLAEHPDVRQAVVLVRDDLPGGPQLVGYVLPRDVSQPPPPATLRQSLAQRLPAYMIPTDYVTLSVLPLTPNGKIDRRALPRPQTPAHLDSPGMDRPWTPTETRLRGLFASLLQRSEIGRDQSFFELGGHSLLALRLFSRIEEAWGQRLPIETLLEAPTIAALATRIDNRRAVPAGEGLVPIKVGSDPQPLFLMPSATGNTLFWHRMAANAPESLMLLGVDPPRSEAGEPWMVDLDQTLAGMAAAIEKRQPEGPLALLGYSSGGHLAQELARRLEERGRTLNFVGLIDTAPLTNPSWSAPRASQLGSWLVNLGFWLLDNNHRQSWKNLRNRLASWGKRGSGTKSEAVSPSGVAARQRRFRVLLTDLRPAPSRSPLTLFRARSQSPWKMRPECLGWMELGCAVETVCMTGVDHVDMMREPHVHHLARVIFETVARSRRSGCVHALSIEPRRGPPAASPSQH